MLLPRHSDVPFCTRMDLIAAIATPQGVGAISIVRVSGEGAWDLVARFFSSKRIEGEPTPNTMYLGHFAGDGFDEQCMAVYFRAPRSYTGEDVVELQLHGGVTVTDQVLKTLLNAGARLAHPGEFSRRAFFNGKVSLSQAEGILGVINAESKSQLVAARSLMQGSLHHRIQPILDKLQELIWLIEASLDYPDEMQEELEGFNPRLDELDASLKALLATADNGRLLRHGVSVAIIGSPNAGKSSLLNAILREDRAIVTDVAGTTRDTIVESVSVDGIRLNILDTAGLRATDDLVESLGVKRALDAAERADVVVYLLDADRGETPDPDLLKRLEGKRVEIVYNKMDIAETPQGERAICAKTGEGVEPLLRSLASLCRTNVVSEGVLSEERHQQAVASAANHLAAARASWEGGMPLDCVAVDLRAAYSALGEVDGATATDQILDGIFGRFCIGK